MIGAVREISTQPDFVKELLAKIIDAQRMGRDKLNILFPLMTPEKYHWLKENGFEINYSEGLSEYEVSW